jgi:hypothetical protein
MFKHPKCGGQHETVSQARECEQGNTAPKAVENHFQAAISSEWGYDANSTEETWPWTEQRVERREYSPSDRKPFTMGYAYAEALADRRANGEPEPVFMAPEPESQPTPARESYATPAQEGFIGKLLAEREWEPFGEEGNLAESVSQGKSITKREASILIGWLKEQPKAAAKAAHKTQPWRELAEKVPAGYYGVVDAERKNHFYRVSVGRNGFYKIQEQASEELHFVSLNRYEGILQHILDFGLDNAGKFYATEKGSCRRCNRVLTDNTGNPYFEMGYGPECGAK